MDHAYKIMFAVGVLYTVVSFLISGISGALHLGSHIGHHEAHIGGHHLHGSTDNASGYNAHIENHAGGVFQTFFSWFSILLNPMVAVAFLTVFGGIGILGSEYFRWIAVNVFIIALISGTISSFLLYRFVAIPLYNSENSTDVSQEDLIGTAAEVASDILKDGFGKIKYTVNSIRYTAAAKHVNGNAVKQGQKVIIYKIEKYVFYVTEMPEI